MLCVRPHTRGSGDDDDSDDDKHRDPAVGYSTSPDLWALGVLTYYFSVGRKPFRLRRGEKGKDSDSSQNKAKVREKVLVRAGRPRGADSTPPVPPARACRASEGCARREWVRAHSPACP